MQEVYSPTNTSIPDGVIADVPFDLDNSFSGETTVAIENATLVNRVPELITPTNLTDGILRAMSRFLLNPLKGWNLFSLPIDPDPSEVVNVFSSNKLSRIWEWLANAQDNTGFSQVDTLTVKKGYWGYFRDAEEVIVTGFTGEDRAVSLVPGWNLIGVTEEVSYPNDPLIGRAIWQWNAQQTRFRAISTGGILKPGGAYWIFATDFTTLFE